VSEAALARCTQSHPSLRPEILALPLFCSTLFAFRNSSVSRAHDLRSVLSELGLKECFGFEPEAEKDGSGGGELGGRVRRLSGWCNVTAGAPPRHWPVVVRDGATSQVRVMGFQMVVAASSGDTTGYKLGGAVLMNGRWTGLEGRCYGH
jgi:hypothetical protein